MSTAPILEKPRSITANKLVLNVGCGAKNNPNIHQTFKTDDWHIVRLDIDPKVEPDYVSSITDMSVVPSNAYDALWSSHNLEHLEAYQVPQALKEFHRVLKPNDGFALITLPDIKAIAKFIFEDKLEDPIYNSASGPICPIDVLYGHRGLIQRGQHYMAHRTAFTAKTLGQALQKVGFKKIEVKTDGLNLWASAHK